MKRIFFRSRFNFFDVLSVIVFYSIVSVFSIPAIFALPVLIILAFISGYYEYKFDSN
jgi:hypothetical protein